MESLEGRYLFSAGTGLTGQYFDNMNFTSLRLTRVDSTVNFNWGTASPAAGFVSSGTYSVRWTGAVQAQFNETYTFFVNGDDGYRLWVNDQMVLNNFVDQTATETSGQIALRAGQLYNLRLEYYQNTSTAQVALSWSSPSTAKQVVPQAQLYSAATDADRGSATSETWTNFGGSSLLSVRTNTNFINSRLPAYRGSLYQLESVAQNVGPSFATKVRGWIVPDVTGTYRFAISGSTDAQFNLATSPGSTSATRVAYTNGATSYRNFTARSTQQSASFTLTAGQRYYFEVWHKAGQSTDHFSVAWQTPWASTSWTVVDGNFLVPVGLDTPAPAVPASGPFADLFGNASTAHPRILGTPDQWAKAAALANSGGRFATYRANILAAADAHLDDAAITYSASTTQATLQDFERDVTQLAAAYRLTGNTVYADKAISKMQDVLSWTNWDGGNQALGIGMGATGLAAAYSWLNNYITATLAPADVQAIDDNVSRLIITPVLNTLRANSGAGNYWVPWQNNWTFVVAGGALSAALAIAPDYSALTSELIARAIPRINNVIDRTMGTNAGGSEEGPGYNTYGGVYLVKALAAMQSTLGTDFGISRSDGFSQWANFMFGQYANNDGSAMAMFSEGQWTGIFEPWNFYFATRFNRPDAAWFIREKFPSNSADPLALLWWDDRGTAPSVDAIRTEFASVGDQSTWNSEEVFTTRTTWADPAWDAPTLFFKGGGFENRHEVLDAGTWNYDSQGKRWFPVIYHGDYGLPGYINLNTATHPNRWDYYANRAESKNTLVINADANADQVVGAQSEVVRSLSNSAESVAVLDMTPAYANKPVSSVRRGFRLDKRTGMALIQDEITPTTGQTVSTVDWYVTYNQNDGPAPVISNGGKDAMFAQGSARLYMRIIAGNGTFTVQDARSLFTGTNSQFLNAENNAYSNSYDRLNIRLTNLTAATTLTVAVWGNWGTATPPFPTTTTPLASWFPRIDRQIWLGDIDRARAGNSADNVTVDSVWASNIVQTTGRSFAAFDVATPNRVVPFSFTVPVSSGETVKAAKLVVSLRSNSGSNSNADLLYLNTPNGTLSYRLDATALGWATVDGNLTVREIDLSKLTYSGGTSVLAAVQSGQKLNVAFSGNTLVDWAQLSYDKVNASGTPVGDGGSGGGVLPGAIAITSPTPATTMIAPTKTLFTPFSSVTVNNAWQTLLSSSDELF